jgi:hypothetical protein
MAPSPMGDRAAGHELVSATCAVFAGFVIGAPAWL